MIDADKVVADVQKIVAAAKNVMGSLPYPHYHFLSMVTESGGALEHKNSLSRHDQPLRDAHAQSRTCRS